MNMKPGQHPVYDEAKEVSYYFHTTTKIQHFLFMDPWNLANHYSLHWSLTSLVCVRCIGLNNPSQVILNRAFFIFIMSLFFTKQEFSKGPASQYFTFVDNDGRFSNINIQDSGRPKGLIAKGAPPTVQVFFFLSFVLFHSFLIFVYTSPYYISSQGWPEKGKYFIHFSISFHE